MPLASLSLSPDATPLGASTPSMMNARQCADFFSTPPHLATGMAPTRQSRSFRLWLCEKNHPPPVAQNLRKDGSVQRNHSLVSPCPSSPTTQILGFQVHFMFQLRGYRISTSLSLSLLCAVRSENGRNAISEARAQHAPHVFPPPRRAPRNAHRRHPSCAI